MRSLSWQESLSLAFGSTRRRIKGLHAKNLQHFDVTPQQMGYLLCLEELGPVTLGRLAKQVGSDDPTASRVIGRLAEKDLVRMSTDRADRRCAQIKLTRQGRALVPKLQDVAWRTERALREGISDAEIDALWKMIERLWKNIERASPGAAPARVPGRAAAGRRS